MSSPLTLNLHTTTGGIACGIPHSSLYFGLYFFPEAGSPAYQWVCEVLLKRHFKHRALAKPINMFETIARMMGSGLGWSILPENCCRGLHDIPLLKQTVYYDIGIVRHKRFILSHAAQVWIPPGQAVGE